MLSKRAGSKERGLEKGGGEREREKEKETSERERKRERKREREKERNENIYMQDLVEVFGNEAQVSLGLVIMHQVDGDPLAAEAPRASDAVDVCLWVRAVVAR